MEQVASLDKVSLIWNDYNLMMKSSKYNLIFLKILNVLNVFLGLKASKLRHALRFRWTQSMLGQGTEAQLDSVFEAGNILMDVAFWYMKHAAMISAKEDLKVNAKKKHCFTYEVVTRITC